MKRLLALLLALCVALPAAALASPVNLPGRHIRINQGDPLPETLQPVFAGSEWAGVKPVTGYLFARFDQWSYAYLIQQDEIGYIFSALAWMNGQWHVTSSRAAIRQDQPPQMLFAYLDSGMSDSELDSYALGSDVTLAYPDGEQWRWFQGSNGWRLASYTLGSNSVYVSPAAMDWGGVSVYNTQDTSLAGFDITTFPRTLAEAQTLAAADPALNDNTLGITCLTPDTDDRGGICPVVSVYESASASSRLTGRMMHSIEVTVLEANSAWARVRTGDVEGWIPRANIKIGLERSSQMVFGGDVRIISDDGGQALYTRADKGSQVLHTLSGVHYVTGLYMPSGGEWMYVLDSINGCYGWLPSGVCGLTSNFAHAYVRNDKPENRLHLRTAPSKSAQSLGKYYTGVELDMLWQEQVHDGWRRVSIQGVVGWMNTDYLSFASNGNYSQLLPPLGQVTGTQLNLRRTPGYDGAVLTQLPGGAKAEILGIAGAWAHVRLRNGLTGYMLLDRLGGEPAQAASGKTKLTRAIVTGMGQTIPAGTEVIIPDRPHVQWHYPDPLNANYDTAEYNEPATFWVSIPAMDTGAFVTEADVEKVW